MCLRHEGKALELEAQALAARIGKPARHVVVLVHGLCMNDLQWRRNDHDHGAALARDLGCTALYLHYNSGRRISTNGREFAALLDALVAAWPVPLERLSVVGHSMGGLVARSACHVARQEGQAWLGALDSLVFLGSPHHGAPAERAGNGFDRLLRLTAYTAPFARLGGLRSAGIRDLRHGNLLDADWQSLEDTHAADARTPVPLPTAVRSHAVAATRREQPGALADAWVGDGLVPVASALGRHVDKRHALRIPRARQWIATGASHFDLLDDPRVYQRLRDWLAPSPPRRRARRPVSR
jgi:pimeloyl-ACP methyl ester carboxylesterase